MKCFGHFKRSVPILIMVMLTFFFASCASMGKTELGRATTGYEIGVATIKNIDNAFQKYKESSGKVTAEQAIAYEKVYKAVVQAQEVAYNALIVAIQVNTEENYAKYTEALSKFKSLIETLKTLIKGLKKENDVASFNESLKDIDTLLVVLNVENVQLWVMQLEKRVVASNANRLVLAKSGVH